MPELTLEEAAERQAIRDRHQAELARRGVTAATSVRLTDLEQHAQALAAAGVVFGPDTSEYQGKPAWGTVKASGCALGFYKVSEGRTYEDPSHQWNRSHVPGAGLVPLGYHFLYYSAEYAANPALWGAQAAFFASLVDPAAGHVLDVEAAATAGHWLGVREWVTEYRKLFPGHPLGCYSNLALWQNRSRMPYDPAGLFDYVWHAGAGNGYYTAATGNIAAQWAGTNRLVNSFADHGYPNVRLWQLTDHAQVPGVGGSFCDGNAWQGTAAELRALITTTGDTSMSAQDVADLKAYLTSPSFLQGVADAVGGRTSFRDKDPYDATGKTALTVDRILNEVFRGVRGLTASADELSPAAVQSVVDALAAKLTGGLQVQGVDYDRVRQLLGEGLDEHLSTLRIVTDTATPTGP